MNQLYLIPNIEEITKISKLAEENHARFEYNDFFLPDLLDNEEMLEERIGQYNALQRIQEKDSMHGAFFDVTIFSSDRKIRQVSEYRVEQSLHTAKKLKAEMVIFHTNYLSNFNLQSYRQNWVEKNAQFWTKMLKKYKDLKIYMENMFDNDPYLLAELGERMKMEERFGVCFDYAHAAISSTDLKEWVKTLAPYIKHMHINDNDLLGDNHDALGDGKINWEEYGQLIERFQVDASVLVEVREYAKQVKSLDYLKKNKVYPFSEK